MNNFFTDNFVDYDDPPIDSSSNLTPETRDFSLPSPNSDSTGLYPTSQSPQAYVHNFSATELINFDLMTYTNQEQHMEIKQELPEASKKGTRRKANKATTPAYTEDHSSENSSEGKILDKSKRIQKRAAAKERTKQKQSQLDITNMFAGIDPKFLPEGYDDPNLDERTKKKMIQMVRNRISAQNSRDRKKGYIQELEQINAKLEEDLAAVTAERDNLAIQLQNAQSEIQMLRENGGQACQNCQNINKEDPFIITSHDGVNQEEPAGGFSGLSSPRLARFASSRSGFLGMFAFIGIIAMVAVVNIGGNEQFGLQSGPMVHLKETRMLDVQSEAITGENIVKEHPGYITQVIPDYSKSLVLQNIHQIKHNFEQTCEPAFKNHLQKISLYNGVSLKDDVKKVEAIELTLEDDNKNGIVKYDSARASSNLRKASAPVLVNTPPAISEENGAHTSTLFCSSGHEFYDTGNQNVRISAKSNLTNNNTLDLEKADYLQLLVPKSTIARSNIKNRLTDIYGEAIYYDDQSDNDTMLEIWCKVFMVRELPSY